MNFTSLVYFVAVAQENSFSRASEKLFVAQPTLSRHILNLEEELGYKLFIRDTHSVRLTEEGRSCLQYAQNILQNVERMKQIHTVGKEADGIVQVGFVESVENFLVLELVREVRKRYPRINVVAVPGNPAEIRKKLNENKLDILYIPKPEADTIPEIGKKTVVRQGLRVFMAKDHPLAGKKEIRMTDLSRERLIMFRPESAPEIYHAIQNRINRLGVHFREIVFADTPSEICMMVSIGAGVGLNASIGTLNAYDVIIKQIEDCRDGFDVMACWKKKNANPVLELVTTLIHELNNNRIADMAD